ncbi:hypothetical protein [Clostridium sporogenes]|uniref:hypothetical protein n=1 Tax=Clostridium sporogenes TaxID=1509 RepID=UPI0013D0846D|nr:hypothetical protein [Clostridium sporogenes]NFP92398.1 hypothetical protein [Clostridium sporogenes]
MGEWSEELKEIINEHNKRRNGIEKILNRLLDTRTLNIKCTHELIDTNTLVWDINIGLKNFTLDNEEIVKAQEIHHISKNGFDVLSEEKKDLEETIKKLILEKIK